MWRVERKKAPEVSVLSRGHEWDLIPENTEA